MPTYVTLFSVGKGSEALVIDQLAKSNELIVWSSKEEYFAAREADPEPIDGGEFSYGLAAGKSNAPDSLISNSIVSFLAPESLLARLADLHAAVRALRGADWPEWPE